MCQLSPNTTQPGNKQKVWETEEANKATHTVSAMASLHVCVCVCVGLSKGREPERTWSKGTLPQLRNKTRHRLRVDYFPITACHTVYFYATAICQEFQLVILFIHIFNCIQPHISISECSRDKLLQQLVLLLFFIFFFLLCHGEQLTDIRKH